jgi:hypothetical protein
VLAEFCPALSFSFLGISCFLAFCNKSIQVDASC